MPFSLRAMGSRQSLPATLTLYLRPLEKFEGYIQLHKWLLDSWEITQLGCLFDPFNTTACTERGSSIMNKEC